MAQSNTEDGLSRWEERQQRVLQILEPCFTAEIKVWNGHFRSGKYFYSKALWGTPEEHLRSTIGELVFINVSDEDLQRMEEAKAKGALLDPIVVFKNRLSGLDCPFCEQRLRFGYDGERFVVVNDPCPYPEGLTSEWELNVPSGKLAIANDLRRWFPISGDHNLNSMIGRHLEILAYSKVGMAYGFVGNTCPGVYRTGDSFVIGAYSDELWDEDAGKYVENPDPCLWGEEVASICTDLWWYSIVDHDELLRRIAHYTPDEEVDWDRITVVDVKPGVYHFRHPPEVEEGSATKFATFEWVRDPDPLVDYVGREEATIFTALEVLIEHCLAWPTLYMNLGYDDRGDKNRAALVALWKTFSRSRKTDCLARAADQIMCVLGSGIEWHENGFPRTSVSEDAKQLAAELNAELGTEGIVPPFGEKRRHWYPIAEGYGGLCQGARIQNKYTEKELIHLAPSFVLLGLNICQNAIKGGETPRLSTDVWPPAHEIPFCRERMKLFGRCYRGLRLRYPDLVFDAEFDRWMQEVDFDKYVEDFDFGPIHPPKEKWGNPPTTIKQGDYFELDARKLKEGHFCWHPKYMTGWAAKENAQRYCLGTLAGTVGPMGHLHFEDNSCRGAATIPLRVVGRVVRGTGEGYTSKILEVAFDYGTPAMCNQRWGIGEGDMAALRQFNGRREYQALLAECKAEFIAEEAKIDALVSGKSRK